MLHLKGVLRSFSLAHARVDITQSRILHSLLKGHLTRLFGLSSGCPLRTCGTVNITIRIHDESVTAHDAFLAANVVRAKGFTFVAGGALSLFHGSRDETVLYFHEPVGLILTQTHKVAVNNSASGLTVHNLSLKANKVSRCANLSCSLFYGLTGSNYGLCGAQLRFTVHLTSRVGKTRNWQSSSYGRNHPRNAASLIHGCLGFF